VSGRGPRPAGGTRRAKFAGGIKHALPSACAAAGAGGGAELAVSRPGYSRRAAVTLRCARRDSGWT
jgi:hypothetical protein